MFWGSETSYSPTRRGHCIDRLHKISSNKMAFTLRNVLILDNVASCCAQILQDNGIQADSVAKLSKEELLARIPNYDGVIVRSATKITADVIDVAKNLKIIGRAGTGVDNIDVSAASRHGIIVMNTPAGNTLSAAEHTCAMMCAMSRYLPQGHMSLKEGRWDRKLFMGNELNGKTLAIVGLGKIGKEVATRMQSFGMTTIGYDPIIPASEAAEFNTEWMELEQLWSKADYITVHTPLIPQTRGLLGEKTFPLCKPGVRVINVARGGIIDEAALLKALESGQCGGAALDVFEQEPPTNSALIQHPKVVCTPHLGASTEEAQLRVAMEIAEQMVDAVNGKSLFGAINAHALSNALKPETKPLVSLGECLGAVATALCGQVTNQTQVQVITYGDSLKQAGSYLGAAVTVGLLRNSTSNGMNLVNAGVLAKEIGIQIATNHQDCSPVPLTSPCVSVVITVNGASHKISGSVMNGSPVLLEIDDAVFVSGVMLQGNMLVYNTQAGAAAFPAIASVLSASNQILSYGTTPPSNNGSWSAIQLASPLPSVDSLKQHASFAAQLSLS
ncbi:D-3-phosphoglycerate dehydrogenase-like [Patiria miniata]|uniref:D-3-phosphoglycerate dehydrogenase n=1 Tax=Patiria miniata TaxID=46514 RepID=A0A913Z2H4_PATMI|nr:D-3-phosphoglycerate dehydrogenase-like [Patiria miniata]